MMTRNHSNKERTDGIGKEGKNDWHWQARPSIGAVALSVPVIPSSYNH